MTQHMLLILLYREFLDAIATLDFGYESKSVSESERIIKANK